MTMPLSDDFHAHNHPFSINLKRFYSLIFSRLQEREAPFIINFRKTVQGILIQSSQLRIVQLINPFEELVYAKDFRSASTFVGCA
jgi:hypothetical protein